MTEFHTSVHSCKTLDTFHSHTRAISMDGRWARWLFTAFHSFQSCYPRRPAQLIGPFLRNGKSGKQALDSDIMTFIFWNKQSFLWLHCVLSLRQITKVQYWCEFPKKCVWNNPDTAHAWKSNEILSFSLLKLLWDRTGCLSFLPLN